MRAIPKSWNIDTVYRRKDKINPKPQYQRTPVWKLSKKQLLIDSILRDYDIPKIYLRESPEEGFEHEVVDGQQRLRAIWEYRDNEFPLGEDSNDLSSGDLEGLHYDELEADDQDRLCLYELAVVIIEGASELEIRDLFSRLQEGVTLNPAEKRNALAGGMRDFIANLGENHRVFPLTRIPATRFGWHNLAAHVVALELAGGPANIKAPDLYDVYTKNDTFDVDGPQAKRVKRILNILADVLSANPPEMNIKWGFVDLYLAVSVLDREYVIKGREEDILRFFQGFETDRRAVDDPADLIESKDPYDRDMYDYIQAFQTGAGTRPHIETRLRVYRNRVMRDIPDLVPRDQTRGFSDEQRIAIYRRDNESCQSCGNHLEFIDMRADHVVDHAKGGPTTIQNGQALCVACHEAKHREG